MANTTAGSGSTTDKKAPLPWRAMKGTLKLAFTGLKIGIAGAGIKTLILDPIADRHAKGKTISSELYGSDPVSNPASASMSTSDSFIESLKKYVDSNPAPEQANKARDVVQLCESGNGSDLEMG